MVKLNRFIQFNDETVDAKTLLLYERLGRALADAPFLELTERKLLEFRPKEGIISMSVFWRHRKGEETHAGRLSDIYLLTAGFWKHFKVSTWIDFNRQNELHPLRKLAGELLLLLEEFRMSDFITKERPGTAKAFAIRQEAYLAFHKDRLISNMQKSFLADALLNQLYISLYEGILTDTTVDWGPIDYGLLQSILQQAYDAKSTKDNTFIANRIITIIERFVDKDLTLQYYSLGDSLTEDTGTFHYHKGMSDAEKGEEDSKETIEEVFRSWHRENEKESGVHLEYELEHGRSGKSDAGDAAEGNEEALIEEIGYGNSEGNENEHWTDGDSDKKTKRDTKKKAGNMFGKEHLNVIFEEKRITSIDEVENRKKLVIWREEQKPYVRSFVEEMKKRIDLKEDSKRERLMKGRLSTKLTTMVVDERPKPFYRKNAPSVKLDAVFGLLVDGSASMLDKLDETKRAVLLFHDVLRQLDVSHEISSYYEDAYNASKEMQPNVFGLMHTFIDRNKDNGPSILSFDANEDNRDGFAIRWMADRLSARQEMHKFLLVFSDGEPSAFGYDRNGVLDTAEAVMETEKRGISVIHLFLTTEEPTDDQKALFTIMFGNKTASSNSVESFADQTLRILRKLLAIVIRNT
ncbi:vWA domain-containing protein [Sporosarcina soli]|uniref:VWA domain-containing protein n=1 Tax=Sporosarcina soli TaxID=334736 RepID=A0ABW0TDV3_9BACL